MSQWNDCCFEGNLGADPESVIVSLLTKSERQLWKAQIAIYRGKNKPPMWIEVVTMQAEIGYELLDRKKGDKIRVRGSIACQPYISKVNSEPKAGLSIWADEITYLPRQQQQSQQPAPQQKEQEPNWDSGSF